MNHPLKDVLDELLETRRRIAAGECGSFDEVAYLAEVEDVARSHIESLFAESRAEIERHTKDYVDAYCEISRLRDRIAEIESLLFTLSNYDWDDVLDRLPDAWGQKAAFEKLRRISRSPTQQEGEK